jgi:ATP-dependent Lon protease
VAKLLLAEANRGDFEELPQHVREGLEVHYARRYRDVVRHSFAGGDAR